MQMIAFVVTASSAIIIGLPHDSPPSVVLHICNGGGSVIVVLHLSPTHHAPCL